MKRKIIEEELLTLSQFPGIRACALVESDSGLVWHSVGSTPLEATVWEASAEYWRLNRRMRGHFSMLGDLGAAVMFHIEAMLVLLPCPPTENLLVACVAGHRQTDWQSWQQLVKRLGGRLCEADPSLRASV